ncbi:ORF6N domain-containing protein [Halobacteriovorax sp. HLS]|uniref:ORF6N domain-containing protein n=1 Tax=Halobacteriovorax sp. HLS TaxID=2234000 RepID=UPI000FDA617B|nr:ORF6N domain-containing protein [Halobacteriovorax sp. HLS]
MVKKDKELLEITNNIHIFRNQKVMFDRDLAELYGVEIRAINQAVKRNQDRFPSDFCFKLNFSELAEYKSQSVISEVISTRKGVTPTVFTEQGAYALSFVLRSPKAVEMGLFIARAFTYLRRFILKNENLMMELKNNDHLSKTFSSFEKRIEQDLVVLYKNTSKFEKRFNSLEVEIKQLKKLIKK